MEAHFATGTVAVPKPGPGELPGAVETLSLDPGLRLGD
jgi:hypothetical protein